MAEHLGDYEPLAQQPVPLTCAKCGGDLSDPGCQRRYWEATPSGSNKQAPQ